MKITHPVTRAAFGVAALVAIALLANWLVALTPLGNRGIDFTENRMHTLSDGTKAILGELDTPVAIRYYATRDTDYMPEEMKLHMRRVDDMLKEYAILSKGKVRIENLDPEPDTDAEDSANLDGISGQRFNDQNLFFGIAIACLDRTSVIPFLDPRNETMLEYELSKAIADVSTPTKPKLGIMSALPIQGGPAMMMGQQPSRPWVIYQQLKQSYDVVDVPMENLVIDPAEIKTLLLIHPADISDEAQFAIDQYLLKGGTVIACLDAHSLAAQMTGGGNPMMGMPGAPTISTLPKLLSAWGVEFESGQALADPVYTTRFENDVTNIAVLTLPDEAMSQKDSTITRGLNGVILFIPGAITRTDKCQVGYTSLIRSTERAGFVDAMKASQFDPSLEKNFKSSGKSYDLVAHLQGNFKTAFPNGKPGSDGPKANENDTTPAEEPAKDNSLKESTSPGNVFLIADVDAFYDRFAYHTQQIGNMQMAAPINGNGSMLLNLIDQTVGSKHLIGCRSRTAARRPFTVIEEMEDNFNKQVGAKIEEFEEKQRVAQQKLNDLQSQKARGNELRLSPEQEAEIRKLREEQVRYSKLIREQQKDLRRQKDDLAGRIILLNVGAMPSFVILFGIGLYIQRRSYTRAR